MTEIEILQAANDTKPCWFCRETNCDLYSAELDTPIHLSCVKAAAPDDPEAMVFRREFMIES